MPWYRWSQTAAINGDSDLVIDWLEGMSPSSVNDSARSMMAETAKYRDDISGAIITSGTSTAYSLSSYSVFASLALLNGQIIAFSPHATNAAGAVTLNLDSLGPKPLRSSPGVELQAGTIIQGSPYVAVYNNSDGAFYLQNFFGQPNLIPIGGLIDFAGSTLPGANWAFPRGQNISRTVYATLFALVGTQFGSGDGTSTFALPDLTGRVVAMAETTATRLTTAGFGGNSTVLGAVGGAEKETLLTANLPPYTPAGGVGVSASGTAPIQGGYPGTTIGGAAAIGTNTSGQLTVPLSISASGSFSGTPQGGTSAPVATVPPLMILNKILRIA